MKSDFGLRTAGLALVSGLGLTAPVVGEGVDPLDAHVETSDALRFAAVFEATDGQPDAAELQAGYLDGAGEGVAVFTPHRIVDAENLATRIAADPEAYRRAIEVCLPAVEAAAPDLRSIYLALAGLLPEAELPEIHVVMGAGNSGGTAQPGIQVLGLEVICAVADSDEAVRAQFRRFFAHETIHTFQTPPTDGSLDSDPLLAWSMIEGVADFMAYLVTGDMPEPSRDTWAREREAWLWREFQADRAAIAAGDSTAVDRWLGNYRNAPEGWPWEAGYWVGMQVAQAYFDQAEDKRAAIADLMRLDSPSAILAASGYAERFAAAD